MRLRNVLLLWLASRSTRRGPRGTSILSPEKSAQMLGRRTAEHVRSARGKRLCKSNFKIISIIITIIENCRENLSELANRKRLLVLIILRARANADAYLRQAR